MRRGEVDERWAGAKSREMKKRRQGGRGAQISEKGSETEWEADISSLRDGSERWQSWGNKPTEAKKGLWKAPS